MNGALALDVTDGQAVRLAADALATRFELVYWGPRAAGEQALAEIAQLDVRLCAAHPASDISWINAHAGLRAVKVEPRTFTLLQRCVELSEETDGAFDITVGPLLQAWKVVGAAGKGPSPELIADARTRVGYRHLLLDPRASTVRFRRSGMAIDLGAAARGYALDAAIAVLRAHGVQAALLRGGSRSVRAIGEPPGGSWTIRWEPRDRKPELFVLRDLGLSLSDADAAVSTADRRRDSRVFDPMIGLPVPDAHAAVTGPCSLECEALSTALLVLDADWVVNLKPRFPGYSAAVV